MDPSTPFIRRVRHLAPLLCVLTVFVAAPTLGEASPPPAVVQRIDERILEARRKVDHWDALLQIRRERVRKLSAVLGHVRAVTRSTVRTSDVALRRAIAHRRKARRHLFGWRGILQRYQVARSKAMAALAGAGVSGLPGGSVTYGRWATAFLSSIGAPTCRDNMQVIVAWETAESTLARYNPLATTLALPGATQSNKAGVQNYLSFAQGIDATRATLLADQGSFNYASIVDDLLSCAPAGVSATAIHDSYWCSGCAAGAYVVNRLPDVRQNRDGYASRSVGVG